MLSNLSKNVKLNGIKYHSLLLAFGAALSVALFLLVLGWNFGSLIRPAVEWQEQLIFGQRQELDNFSHLPLASVRPPQGVFLFFGDVMIDRNVGKKIKENGFDYLLTKLAGEDKQFFQGADLVGANLEGAVTDGGAHYSPAVPYDFAFAPALVVRFQDYGFNFFSIANNHLTDQGSAGVEETEKNLADLGFNFVGCPDAVAGGPCSSRIISVGDLTVGAVGLSMVYHNFDLPAAEALVKDLKSQTDLVIVNLHWGNEYEHQFNRYQQAVGRALIDAGADIIIGHHPHVVQGVEVYRGRPIFYSLGNFIFDQYFSPDTQTGLAV
ncbi:MAG: CapA family protein, partial [Patescibacteria group bacterium]